MRIFITSFFLLYVVAGYSYSREEIIDYIELYKLIAVEEMQENGIPASIKMAQAILESNAGTSDLALEANNHFGIKCGGKWDGPTFYKKDDDRDERGRLIKSCFRVFSDGEDSFRAHSRFLLDPSKTYRYGPLFTLDKTDYKSWAWGLSKAGYATNPAYANLLIHLIEKYSLYTFDYYETSNVKFVKPTDLITQAKKVNFSNTTEQKSQNTIISRPGERVSQSAVEEQMEINKLEVLKVRKGQTMQQLAQKYELKPKELLKYNDNNLHLDDYLDEGMYIYLEKKRIWYRGEDKYHIVREGEDLNRISQMYGIRISTLERKNKITADMIPLPGEKIILKGKSVRKNEIPLTYDDVDVKKSNEVSESVLSDDGVAGDLSLHIETNEIPATKTLENPAEPVFDLTREEVVISEPAQFTENTNDPGMAKKVESTTTTYKIIRGDTLYGISRKFGVTVDSIRQNNKLQTDQIRIGQELKIVK